MSESEATGKFSFYVRAEPALRELCETDLYLPAETREIVREHCSRARHGLSKFRSINSNTGAAVAGFSP